MNERAKTHLTSAQIHHYGAPTVNKTAHLRGQGLSGAGGRINLALLPVMVACISVNQDMVDDRPQLISAKCRRAITKSIAGDDAEGFDRVPSYGYPANVLGIIATGIE
jgi:hypothetical protein